MRTIYSYDEVIQAIVDAYETLSADELAEEYNRLFPGQPITYESDGIFAKYIESKNIKNFLTENEINNGFPGFKNEIENKESGDIV